MLNVSKKRYQSKTGQKLIIVTPHLLPYCLEMKESVPQVRTFPSRKKETKEKKERKLLQ